MQIDEVLGLESWSEQVLDSPQSIWVVQGHVAQTDEVLGLTSWSWQISYSPQSLLLVQRFGVQTDESLWLALGKQVSQNAQSLLVVQRPSSAVIITIPTMNMIMTIILSSISLCDPLSVSSVGTKLNRVNHLFSY